MTTRKRRIASEKIPQFLKNRRHWVTWKYETKAGATKPTKVPYNPIVGRASTTDPSTWADFETAFRCFQHKSEFDGIGIVLRDDLVGVDIDDCFVDGELNDLAWDIVENFQSYWEVSPSGKGIRIFARGVIPPGTRHRAGKLEIYDKDSPRYLTVTGRAIGNLDVEHRQEAIDWILKNHFPKKPGKRIADIVESVPEDLQKIIDRASAAENGEKFKSLMAGQWEAEYHSQSDADLALCAILSFWCANDQEVIDQIFRSSGLYRSKWDRLDYQESTLTQASCAEPFDWSNELDEATKIEFQQMLEASQKHSVALDSKSSQMQSKADLEAVVDEKALPQNKQGQVETAIHICQACMQLWHSEDGVPFATYQRENIAVNSPRFRSLLSGLYFEKTKRAIGRSGQDQTIGVLAQKAFRGEAHKVFHRVARHRKKSETIWIDLGNEKFEAVEITRDGWKVVQDYPVKFRRDKNQGVLPYPEHGGAIEDLKQVAACSPEHFPMIVGWLLDALKGHGPYMIALVGGEQGSAKSTLCRFMRGLIDPLVRAGLNSLPREEKDLGCDGMAEFTLVYDNVSFLPEWLADALCRVATGGGIKCRQLYTDNEQMIYDVCNPIILNGIPDVTSRGDFLSRVVSIKQPRIEKRLREADVEDMFLNLRPRLLGALYSLVAVGLAAGDYEWPNLPRMADSASWVSNCWGNDSFIRAYTKNSEETTAIALDDSLLFGALLSYLTIHKDLSASPTSLFDLLKTDELARKGLRDKYPESVRAFMTILRREAPLYRTRGINVEADAKSNGMRVVRISKDETGA